MLCIVIKQTLEVEKDPENKILEQKEKAVTKEESGYWPKADGLVIRTARNRSDDPSGPPLVVDQVAAAVTDSEGGTFCTSLN